MPIIKHCDTCGGAMPTDPDYIGLPAKGHGEINISAYGTYDHIFTAPRRGGTYCSVPCAVQALTKNPVLTRDNPLPWWKRLTGWRSTSYEPAPRGGQGGSATLINSTGTAIGGQGGDTYWTDGPKGKR